MLGKFMQLLTHALCQKISGKMRKGILMHLVAKQTYVTPHQDVYVSN